MSAKKIAAIVLALMMVALPVWVVYDATGEEDADANTNANMNPVQMKAEVDAFMEALVGSFVYGTENYTKAYADMLLSSSMNNRADTNDDPASEVNVLPDRFKEGNVGFVTLHDYAFWKCCKYIYDKAKPSGEDWEYIRAMVFGALVIVEISLGDKMNVALVNSYSGPENAFIPDSCTDDYGTIYDVVGVSDKHTNNKSETAPKGVFEGQPIKTITLPKKVVYIGQHAFEYTTLNAITLPENVIFIADKAFAGTNIQSLVIPQNVIYIDSNIIRGCSQLKEITFMCPYGTILNVGSFFINDGPVRSDMIVKSYYNWAAFGVNLACFNYDEEGEVKEKTEYDIWTNFVDMGPSPQFEENDSSINANGSSQDNNALILAGTIAGLIVALGACLFITKRF